MAVIAGAAVAEVNLPKRVETRLASSVPRRRTVDYRDTRGSVEALIVQAIARGPITTGPVTTDCRAAVFYKRIHAMPMEPEQSGSELTKVVALGANG
jgi:hypothetical protein